MDVYADLEGLPPCCESLFRTAEAKAFCHGLPWYRNLIGSTAEPGERLHIYGLTTEGNCPEALLLARQRSSGPRLLGGAELAGCSNLYSLRFAPLVRPGQNRADQVANGFVEAIHGDSAGWTTVRFDCWDRGCPLFDAFVQAFRTRRWLVQTYFHFANWYEQMLSTTVYFN